MKVTLKAARVNKELTQRQAAEEIGVSRETIGNWENGGCPNIKYIPIIEEVYGVKYDDIIFLTDKST